MRWKGFNFLHTASPVTLIRYIRGLLVSDNSGSAFSKKTMIVKPVAEIVNMIPSNRAFQFGGSDLLNYSFSLVVDLVNTCPIICLAACLVWFFE
jgi:hypothetical protein